MASLTANLILGTAGLQAQSKGLQVAGSNLNNVNTPGYSRQQAVLSAGTTIDGTYGPEATGVVIQGVTQARDTFLDQQVQTEASLTSGLTAKQSVYGQVQTALGQDINTTGQSSGVAGLSTSTSGIGGSLDDFFNAFQALSTAPSDPATKSTVIESAGELVDKINTADQNLAGVQSNLTTQIGSEVTSANQLLSQIAGLNKQIATFEVGSPGGALALRDQRESALEQLAGFMNIETKPDPSSGGQIQVFSRDATGNPVTLVDKSNVVSSISTSGSAIQAGSPPTTLALTSGSLTTELQARDGFTQSVRNDLGSLAAQLVTAVNTAANPSGSGQNILAAGTGGTLIAVDPGLTTNTLQASATGNAGGNELANAVASVANQTFSTSGGDQIDGTLGGFYGATVAQVGTALSTAGSDLEDQQLSQQLAVSNQNQESGVSLDEETTSLMQFQRAYQASAHFISVVDNLLDVVINQMGVVS
jgi:flagellar hook-associated protein 1